MPPIQANTQEHELIISNVLTLTTNSRSNEYLGNNDRHLIDGRYIPRVIKWASAQG